MAKIKSAGRPVVNHDAADKRVYRRELCMGDTANGDHTSVSVNSKPLSSFVESASLRTTQRYDWATGTVRTEQLDVLDNARRNITCLHVRPVTNGRHMESERPYGNMSMGMPAMATPSSNKSPLTRSRKNRGK